MDTSYEKRARGWYERALVETDQFIRFLLLFISLEVCSKLEKFNSLRDIKQDSSIRIGFYNRIDRRFLAELKSQLDQKPLQNMNPDGDRRWSGRLDSVNDFDGTIEFVIRARNNLFHGDKGLDEGRDLFIVQAGAKVLQPLVEAIIP